MTSRREGGGVEVLKKIYQELVAIRKELQAIQGDLEHIRKHPFNIVTGFHLPDRDTGGAKKELPKP